MNELLEIKDQENIEKRIFVIRGIQAMLDSDVAELFGVETRRLNEQVKRNQNRFPIDFCFQLNSNEFKNLTSQNATSSYGGRRHLPFAFTEHGIIALAGVLKSDVAAQMRLFIMENGDVLLKLAQLQNRQINFEIKTIKNQKVSTFS